MFISKSKGQNKISLILTLMILISALYLANKWMDGSLDNRSKAANPVEKVEIINNSF